MTLTRETLIDYLGGPLNVDVSAIAEDTPLFSSGLIDSFSMIDLISFIESTGDFRIGPADITLDNFDTLGRIMAYLESR